MRPREAKRYYRLEGIDLAEQSPDALRAKVGGEWHWIPKSVVGFEKRRGEMGKDELVIEEWFAKKMGWA